MNPVPIQLAGGGMTLIMTATVMLYLDPTTILIFIGDLVFGILLIVSGLMRDV